MQSIDDYGMGDGKRSNVYDNRNVVYLADVNVQCIHRDNKSGYTLVGTFEMHCKCISKLKI